MFGAQGNVGSKLRWRPSSAGRAAETGDALLDYCIAWALGRIGTEDAAGTLRQLMRVHSQAAAGLMAREALTDVGGSNTLATLEAQCLEQIPGALREALEADDAAGIATALAAQTQALQPATTTLLVDLYWLARTRAHLREALIPALAKLPLVPNAFRALRIIFKHAEYRFDGEVFGLLAHRFDKAPPGFSSPAYGDRIYFMENHRYRSIKYKEELRKPNSRLAFSDRTRTYLRRRVVPTLRRLGELGASEYVDMATGVLLAFSDEDTVAPRASVTATSMNGADGYHALFIQARSGIANSPLI